MRRPLIAANWKMHGDKEFLATWCSSLGGALDERGPEIALFPPFVYLAEAADLLGGAGGLASHRALTLGAQNVSAETEGAFTGEVSAGMLRDVGCHYALVGHSERRTLYGESDDMVGRKFSAALEAGLTPVLCVGEALEERDADRTLEVVERQLEAVVGCAGREAVCGAVIAYEPVWAIGTGRTAGPDQAQEVHAALRAMLGSGGEQTRIIYGGSVKAANAAALFEQADIDGGLVGGASLNAEEFAAICNKAPK